MNEAVYFPLHPDVKCPHIVGSGLEATQGGQWSNQFQLSN